MEEGSINLSYSQYDRLIVGGTVPVSEALALETYQVYTLMILGNIVNVIFGAYQTLSSPWLKVEILK